METPDYYSILELDPGATQEEIRLAYKRLALAWHPDLSAHPAANRQMQRLNEAYETLSSPERRAEYDLERAAPAVEAPVEPPATEAQTVESSPYAGPRAAYPAAAPQPPPISPERRAELSRQRQAWLQSQLKVLAFSILYTLVLFAWTLVSGQFNLLTILLLLVPVGLVLFNLLRWLKRPVR